MDASFALEGLMDDFNASVEDSDYEAAEALLGRALGAAPSELEAFLHFQFGKLYLRWNKLSSSIDHFGKAAELAHFRGDRVLVIQVAEELGRAKKKQMEQRP